MQSYLNFSQFELEDRINSFVWGKDLTPAASFLIFGPEARKTYHDAEDGIRIKHVIYASELIELQIADIQSRGHTEDDIKYIKENLTDLKNYITQKLGHIPIAPMVDLTLVISEEFMDDFESMDNNSILLLTESV